MLGTQSRCGSTSIQYANILASALATLWWTPFKSRVVQNPHNEVVTPPLLKKCKDLGPQVDSRRYLAARQQALHEMKSVSQTLGVMLLEHIHAAILDASEDETFRHDMRDTIHASRVDIHATLQEIEGLQMKLNATDNEGEQRALEEDLTGQILWFCWCGIFSEVEQRLLEVVNYIRKEEKSTAPEDRDHVRQSLHAIGEIIMRTPNARMDDDVAHLRRIMLDSGAGASKHQLWLAARAAERNKWSSLPTSRNNHLFAEYPHISAVKQALGTGNDTT